MMVSPDPQVEVIGDMEATKMREVFAAMKDELESSYPETIKVPSRHGGYIRVPVSTNPEWYRKLCNGHTNPRRRYPKRRTRVRRIDVLRVLGRLTDGKDSTSWLAKKLTDLAKEYADDVLAAQKGDLAECEAPEF